MVSAIIHVGSQQQVGYTVCFDGSQSTGRNPMGTDGDIFGIRTHTWIFGDGSPEKSGEYFGTVTHVYNTPGTYTVTLTVTDYAGRSARTSKSVTVKTLPKVTVTSKSTSAIVSAISSLNGKPGIVYIPAGSYPITSTITIPANTIIEGAGMANTRIYTSSSNIFLIGGNNVRIMGSEIHGPGKDYNSILSYGKKNLYVDHCNMHSLYSGNWLNRYASSTFEHNIIHDFRGPNGYGIVTTSGAYSMARHNTFYDSWHSMSSGGSGGESGWNTGYDSISNLMYEVSYSGGLHMESHAGSQGRIRICDNVFKNTGYAVGLTDGWGEIRRNKFENVYGYICKFNKPIRSATGTWVLPGLHDFYIDHNTITNCGVNYRIYWGENIYINCRKIDSLIPFEGNAPWDDCVAAYGTISGTVTDKYAGLGISGFKITANGHETTTE
ncbi:MAG: PKD domain-containing protein [Methanophagales archaeon]|nr:PKD domain-containing protein [Methanophagales archaeon]